MSDLAVPIEPAPPAMSAVQRVIGIFFSPVKAYQDIARRPTWLLPLVLFALALVVSNVIVLPRFDWERTITEGIAQSGRTMTNEQIDNIVKFWSKIGTFFGYAMSIIFPLWMAAIPALLYWGIMRLRKARVTYKGALAVCAFSLLPLMIPSIVVGLASLNWESVAASDLGRMVPSTLLFFVPRDASAAVQGLAGRIDLFAFWSLALTIVGLSCVSNWSRGRCAGLVLGLWGFWTLVSWVWTSLFS